MSWVLKKYLGQYVSNLNTDNLSISVTKGNVELHDLLLSPDALKDMVCRNKKNGKKEKKARKALVGWQYRWNQRCS